TPLELRPHVSVIRREHSADVLRIEALRLRRKAHEVDEDHRYDLALFPDRALVRLKRARARVTKTSAFWVLLTAARARQHRQSVRRARSAVTSHAGRF